MAPPKRKGVAKRNSARKILLKEVGTQTEFSEKLTQNGRQLVVVLEKVDMVQYLHENKENEESVPSPSNSLVEKESEPNAESKVLKDLNTPNNYTVFAKPITNNEDANSTLLSRLICEEPAIQVSDSVRIQTRKPKRVQFVKPGPLCYKKKLLNVEDMTVPAVLDEISPNSPPRNLGTIFEQNTEISPNLDLHLNLSREPTIKEVATQTLINNILASSQFSETITHDGVINFSPIGASTAINEVPENIRLQFGGVTTIVSAKSFGQRTNNNIHEEQYNGDEEDDSSDSEHGSNRAGTKFIKIKASTVHIHNHFYKT